MARRLRAADLAVLGLCVCTAPAAAQFGGIFGEPPRPPANVPSRPPAAQPIPPSVPLQPMVEPPPAQPGPAARPAGPASSGIESQPLPPPPGSASAPEPSQPAALPQPPGAPVPGQAGGRRGQPANTAPQPGDEVVTELPSQKIPNPKAVFSGLDKITGRITSFDAALNETVQFGALQVTPRVCYTRPPTEATFTDGFIEVDEVTLQGEVKRLFTGWMFAASPGLHGVEHPIYDVWLTDCKGAPTVADVPPPPAAAPPRAPPRQSASTPRQRQPALRPPQ